MGLWWGYSPVATSQGKSQPKTGVAPEVCSSPAVQLQERGNNHLLKHLVEPHFMICLPCNHTPNICYWNQNFCLNLTELVFFAFAAELLGCWGTRWSRAKPVCWVTAFTSKTICLLVLTWGAQRLTETQQKGSRLASHKFWGRTSLWHGQKKGPFWKKQLIQGHPLVCRVLFLSFPNFWQVTCLQLINRFCLNLQ